MNPLNIYTFILFLHLSQGSVVDITKKNIKSIVGKQKFVVIYVSKSKCEKCAILYPKFALAEQIYRNRDKKDIVFGRITSKKMATEYGITKFPSLAFCHHEDTEIERFDDEGYDITTDMVIDLIGGEIGREHKLTPDSYLLQLAIHNYKEYFNIENVCKFLLIYSDSEESKEKYSVMKKLSYGLRKESKIAFLVVDATKDHYLAKDLTSWEFPVLQWIDGKKVIKHYGGYGTLSEMQRFISDNTGAHRNADGTLPDDAGRIKEIDRLITQKAETIGSSSDVKAILEEAKLIAEKYKDLNELAEYYIYLLQLVADVEYDELAKERDNMVKTYQNGKMGINEYEAYVKRTNVMNVIVDNFHDLMYKGNSVLRIEKETLLKEAIRRHEEL